MFRRRVRCDPRQTHSPCQAGDDGNGAAASFEHVKAVGRKKHVTVVVNAGVPVQRSKRVVTNCSPVSPETDYVIQNQHIDATHVLLSVGNDGTTAGVRRKVIRRHVYSLGAGFTTFCGYLLQRWLNGA